MPAVLVASFVTLLPEAQHSDDGAKHELVADPPHRTKRVWLLYQPRRESDVATRATLLATTATTSYSKDCGILASLTTWRESRAAQAIPTMQRRCRSAPCVEPKRVHDIYATLAPPAARDGATRPTL